MIIADLSVKKVDRTDHRYPDPIEGKPFTEVYRCEVTFSDGSQKEAAFFLLQELGDMNAENSAKMLALFSRAVSRMDEIVEAA